MGRFSVARRLLVAVQPAACVALGGVRLMLAFWWWHAETVPTDMVAKTGSSITIEQVFAWSIKHKQKLLIGSIAVLVVCLVTGFYLWQKTRTKEIAEVELSKLRPTISAQGEITPVTASALLRVADNYPKTPAGARARLLAAGALFNEGKLAEAKTQFDRFLRDYPKSRFRPDALYGSGLCLAALGKSAEAMQIYREIVDGYVGSPVVPRAKLALGRLLVAQNQIAQAKKLFEEVAHAEGGGLLAYQAEIELERLSRGQLLSGAAAGPELQPSRQSTDSGNSAN